MTNCKTNSASVVVFLLVIKRYAGLRTIEASRRTTAADLVG